MNNDSTRKQRVQKTLGLHYSLFYVIARCIDSLFQRKILKNRSSAAPVEKVGLAQADLPALEKVCREELKAERNAGHQGIDDRTAAAATKEQGITKAEMAARMQTSRAQIDRLLDPKNSSATLETLMRAAKVVGRRLRLELV